MQHLEIEKRFLVPKEKLARLKSFIVPNSEIAMNDFYVPNGKNHKDLRLRKQGTKYMITRKRPLKDGDTTAMLETTIELSEPEFAALSKGISTNVEKIRYKVNVGEWRGELDIFAGRLSGLAIVEFEFQNPADLADFEENSNLNLPDITNFEPLAGGRLAETDPKSLRKYLKKLENS